MTVNNRQKFEKRESMMMVWKCETVSTVTPLLREESLGIYDASAVVSRHRLTWFGHF